MVVILPSPSMLVIFYVGLFLVIPTSTLGAKRKTRDKLLAQKRAEKVVELIKQAKCAGLTDFKNCSLIHKQSPSTMNFYMANKHVGTLTVRSPLQPLDIYKNQDGVVVVDPIPDAHFGHTLIIAFIKQSASKKDCKSRKGIYYKTGSGQQECIFFPDTRLCHLMLKFKSRPHLNYSCTFNYIPFVYDADDLGEKQRLQCYENVGGFKHCPITKTAPNPCKNSANCKKLRNREKTPCHWSCDHALMISGGWNKYTNRYRHLQNLQSFYNHLYLHRSFHQKNIKVFFANNATINLNGDSVTSQDTIPAVDSSSIVQHVKDVCSKDSQCIDTFVIYLNGPTAQNGNLLLWDWNQDGSASSNEILPVKDLLAPLRDCNAKNYLIIVDQNFAGHFIDAVKEGRKKYKNFDKIHVLTASDKNTYTWKREFSKKFIEYDNSHIEKKDAPTFARRISLIAKDLMNSENLKQYKINYLSGKNKDMTITGDYGQEAGCTFQSIGSKG